MQNFFEHQDQARRNTRWLITFMALGVAAMGCSIYALLYFAQAWAVTRGELAQPAPGVDSELLGLCLGGTLVLVLCASAYRILSLRGGGARVAEMLGGRLISGNPEGVLEQRFVNVVEEMAIASGVPVPQVFVLDDEAGINAFAAGFSVDDAAIAATRGCLEKLSRQELQGVVAHEFSHVLNGDMRLNVRLMGIVFGIVSLAVIGRLMMRIVGNSRITSSRGRKNGNGVAAAIFLFGLGIFLIGTLGELFGKLIKAAVSRQREFLADASAVQFTRNPEGIAGALKKIGGYSEGATVTSGAAEEASHLFFGDIHARSFLSGLFGTHPPLSDRISRIDPSWNGTMAELADGVAEPEELAVAGMAGMSARGAGASALSALSQAAGMAATPQLGVRTEMFAPVAGGTLPGEARFATGLSPIGTSSPSAPLAGIELSAATPAQSSARPQAVEHGAGGVVSQVGVLTPAGLQNGQSMLAELPPKLRDAAHSPFSACAIVYALLLSDERGAQQKQRQALDALAGSQMHAETLRLLGHVHGLSRRDRLPLIELLAPALRELSVEQRASFTRSVQALIDADQQVSIFEYVLGETLRARLQGQARAWATMRVRHGVLGALRKELELLLSLLAHAGAQDDGAAQRAFAAGAARLSGLSGIEVKLLPSSARLLSALGPALGELAALAPLAKQQLVDACAHVVLADRRLTDDEATLLQAVCGALGAPLPALQA
jgi:Zn-dependent protease with chaperone function